MIEGNDQQPEGVYGDHNQVNNVKSSPLGLDFFYASGWVGLGVCPQIKTAFQKFLGQK